MSVGYMEKFMELEHKFARFGDGLLVSEDAVIEGYASLFGQVDQGSDVVQRGAYRGSLDGLSKAGQRVKMLWQHDPAQPIGVWDEVREDDKGLWVKGRLLEVTQKGREAAELIRAGAMDGLSIGYRTKRAVKNDKGQRVLTELELWEVSLVTFPMLPSARVAAKGVDPEAENTWRSIAEVFDDARQELAPDLARLNPPKKEVLMSKTETPALTGEGVPLVQEVKQAMAGFVNEFKGLKAEVKTQLQQTEERLTMLDRKV